MKLETSSAATASVAREESLARAIVQLNPKSARAKRVVAAVTIGIPATGFAIAMYLMFTGRLSALDYPSSRCSMRSRCSASVPDSIATSRTSRSRHPRSSKVC